MKNEKGITLIALTVTIIVLIIISSVAVNSGIGTINFARFNKAKSEMEIMQSQVNNWYDAYNSIETDEGKSNYLKTIGIEATDTTCDQNKLNTTKQSTGINENKYRYLSKDYLRNNLGMDLTNEFLINIPNRKVILFGGITYENKTYYTPEDFGIFNVESSENVSDIEFQVSQGDNTDIVISDLHFKDDLVDVNISKFKVKYAKQGTDSWTDVTNKVTKYTDEEDNKVKYKFDIPKNEIGSEETEYNVKILTYDNNIQNTKSVSVKEVE